MGAAIQLPSAEVLPEGEAESGIFAVARRPLKGKRCTSRSSRVRPPAIARRSGRGLCASSRRRGPPGLPHDRAAPSSADDVIQEVFFQVFRSLKDFRGQSKFTTWLHRVTVNVVLMHRRSAKSRPVYADEAPHDMVPDTRQPLPDEDFARHERMRAFRRLLDRLAEKKRVVFILHELEGMAPAEIAKVVGAPILTVRTRLFYARRELEAMLADEPTLAGVAQEMASATLEVSHTEDAAGDDGAVAPESGSET